MWFKKMPDVMPDVMLTRYWHDDTLFDRKLARSFRRDGKRWCEWRGDYILLKEDGTCVGDTVYRTVWEAI